MLTSNQNKEIFFLLLLNFDPECVKRGLLLL